jgi:hypothetical protein
MIRKCLFFCLRRLLFSLFLAHSGTRRGNEKRAPSSNQDVGHETGVEQIARNYLLYVILPLWMGSGLLDWYFHRRTRIEKTAGAHESMIHALMMTEAGIPVMLGLFLDVNALVLLLMIAGFFIHEVTAYWDVSYAEGRRVVTPGEQHTHSFLDAGPFMTVSFMICLYWEQFFALLGIGNQRPRFQLRGKRKPLARNEVIGILTATGLTVVLPYAEEFWRCYRTDKTVAPLPETRIPGVFVDEDQTSP